MGSVGWNRQRFAAVQDLFFTRDYKADLAALQHRDLFVVVLM